MGWGSLARIQIKIGDQDLKDSFVSNNSLKLLFLESLDHLASNEIIIPKKIEKPVFFKELKFWMGLSSTHLDYFAVDEYLDHEEIGLQDPIQAFEMLLAVSYFSTYLPDKTFRIEMGDNSYFLLKIEFVNGHLNSIIRGYHDWKKDKFVTITREIPHALDGFRCSASELLIFFRNGIKERLKPYCLPNYLDEYDFDSEYLALNQLNLTKVLPEIGKFQKLKGINLNNNRLRKLPDELFNLPELEELHLDNNKINSIPAEISQLKNLKILSLNSNYIEDLPDEICSLRQLTELKVYGNKLTRLPDQIGLLKELKEIKLSDNKLKFLPDSFCDLKSLQNLHIYRNTLEYLPENFGNLVSLHSLRIEHNNLSSLPDSFSKLYHLRELDLTMSNNNFKKFPFVLTQMENLETLSFGFLCKYNELPKEIEQMKGLKKLNLSLSRKLKSLPDSICNLSNLEDLYINATEISQLPQKMGNLKRLKILSISQTHILKLPHSLSELIGLRVGSDKGGFTIEGQASIDFFEKKIFTKEEFLSFNNCIEYGNLYKFCSEELRSDKNFAWWLEDNTHSSTHYDGNAFNYLGFKLKNDKAFALEYIGKKGGRTFKFFSEALRSDWDVIETALKDEHIFNIEDILFHIPEKIRKNSRSIEKLFNINSRIFMFLHKEMEINENLLKKAVIKYVNNAQHVPEKYRLNKDIMVYTMPVNYFGEIYTPIELQKDPWFVIRAIIQLDLYDIEPQILEIHKNNELIKLLLPLTRSKKIKLVKDYFKKHNPEIPIEEVLVLDNDF